MCSTGLEGVGKEKSSGDRQEEKGLLPQSNRTATLDRDDLEPGSIELVKIRTKTEPHVAVGRTPDAQAGANGSLVGPRSSSGGGQKGKNEGANGPLKVRYATGDQVVLQSKEDGQWYRVVVEDVRAAGEVVVSFGNKDLGRETVPASEIESRLRQRTIHLQGLPHGWTGTIPPRPHEAAMICFVVSSPSDDDKSRRQGLSRGSMLFTCSAWLTNR